MRRPVKRYTMWCIQTPNGKLRLSTLATSRAGAFDKLFDTMSISFQNKHWKNLRSSLKAYRLLNYTAIHVDIVPVRPFS